MRGFHTFKYTLQSKRNEGREQQRRHIIVFGNNLSSLLVNVFLESCSIPAFGATCLLHNGQTVDLNWSVHCIKCFLLLYDLQVRDSRRVCSVNIPSGGMHSAPLLETNLRLRFAVASLLFFFLFE